MLPTNVNPTGMLPFDAARATALGASAVHTDSPAQRKLKKAAGEFESLLLASLWKSMKQTFADPNASESDPAHGTLEDWGIEVMSGAVGQAGGLGIGNMILRHLEPTLGAPGGTHTMKTEVP